MVNNRFAASINNNIGDVLHWINGNNWLFAASTATVGKMFRSTDDALTWTDMTTLAGGPGASCTTLYPGGEASAHYIFADCNNGTVIWKYGPI